MRAESSIDVRITDPDSMREISEIAPILAQGILRLRLNGFWPGHLMEDSAKIVLDSASQHLEQSGEMRLSVTRGLLPRDTTDSGAKHGI